MFNHYESGPSSEGAAVKLDQLVEQPHHHHEQRHESGVGDGLNGGASDGEEEEMPVEKLQPQVSASGASANTWIAIDTLPYSVHMQG